jgi:hypothetical protein
LSIAAIFSLIEQNKERLDLETYSLSQTTLESVFLSFAKKQIDVNEEFVESPADTASPKNGLLNRARVNQSPVGQIPLVPAGHTQTSQNLNKYNSYATNNNNNNNNNQNYFALDNQTNSNFNKDNRRSSADQTRF